MYQAKSDVRSRGAADCDSIACSVGRKTLTSPDDGFSVPTTAMSRSGQNAVTRAKPMPVANISAREAISNRRRFKRPPDSPTASVSAADPSIVPVTMAPTARGDKPSDVR